MQTALLKRPASWWTYSSRPTGEFARDTNQIWRSTPAKSKVAKFMRRGYGLCNVLTHPSAGSSIRARRRRLGRQEVDCEHQPFRCIVDVRHDR